MNTRTFYLACLRDNVGGNVAFHAQDGAGYVTNLDKAHIYTHKEMQEKVTNGHLRVEMDLPLCVEKLQRYVVYKVDMQVFDLANLRYPIAASNTHRYVILKQGQYDGNDLIYRSRYGNTSNLELAQIVSADKFTSLLSGELLIPFEQLLVHMRRTFPVRAINRRKMIQGAGIIGVHKPRPSKSSGKTRHNCPVCGRINWDYHYELNHCSNGCDI